MKIAVVGNGAPFYESVNEVNSPTEAVWSTLAFDVFTTNKETFCGLMVEKGTISIIINASPGLGDDAALIAVEAIADVFFRQVDSSGRLVLVSRSAPDEIMSNDGSPSYMCAVDLDYEFYIN
jgi:hypothetical protein